MKRLLIVLFLCFDALALGAQEISVFRHQVEKGYDFLLYTPEGYNELPDSAKAKVPLVMHLHGGSLVGSNVLNSMRYGTIAAIRFGRDIDALVLNPQTPGKEAGAIGAWNPEKLCNLLDWTMEHFPYDSCRVYVVGMSTGGYGTMNFVNAHPERVAAAMALCGGCSSKTYEGISQVPMWIIHGTADVTVGVGNSRKVYNWLVENNCAERVIFDTLPGYDHSSLARFFFMPMTYQWLFSHSREQEGHPVNRTVKLVEPTAFTAYSNPDTEFKKKVRITDPGVVPVKEPVKEQ